MQDLELGVGFPISSNDIDDLMTDYEEERLNSIGGLKGLALSLRSDLENGLSTNEAKAGFIERKQKFGSNIYPQFPTPHYMVFLGQTFKDPTMIILSVAAVVSLVLGSVPISDSDASNEGPQWIQGLAISIVVIIQTNVMAINNWSKDKKFRKLNEQRNDSKTKVIRSNVEHLADIEEVNVGDVVVLEQGDFVPADGFYIYGHNLLVDEANMTGESDAVLKSSSNPILYSGSHVVEGSGRMLALRIGPSSTWGKTLAQLKSSNAMTPLQRKLKKLVILLGKIGAVCAALVFAALTIWWVVTEVVDKPWEWGKLRRVIEFFIVAITLVVVAVPEGMPLCVTVCLAYTMGKMLKEKCLVRRLSACEAMGGVTTICSDKTGTLTENRMTVVEGWISNNHYQKFSETIQLDDSIKSIVSQSIAVNSKAFIDQTDDKVEFVGNKTECAMLVFLEQRLETDYRVIRKETQVDRIQDFTSDTKYMCTWITTANQPRVLFKGAPEVILTRSKYYMDSDGQINELNDHLTGELNTLIHNMAGKALRTIALAYTDDASSSNDLILVAVFGIEDPLRVEVPQAVSDCKAAGIVVRMITGDNLQTAKKIAENCGILTPTGIAMDGSTFDKLTEEQLEDVIPRLQVIARSTPQHKLKLVSRLRRSGQLVAVTGDGINDVLAMSEANIGVSMGITGTDVAKQASDIIVLDDNFASITKTVFWGRTVFENIRRFLQFQLTIITTTLAITFISAVSGYGIPLRAIQLLFVNLFMDCIAALSSSLDKPSRTLLDQTPYGVEGSILTNKIKRNVLAQSIYQVVILCVILFAGPYIWSMDNGSTLLAPNQHYTMVFATFAMMQIFNLFNCRRIHDQQNVFETLQFSWILLLAQGLAIGILVIIVHFSGWVFYVAALTWYQWLSCIFLAALGIAIRYIGMYIVPLKPKDQKQTN